MTSARPSARLPRATAHPLWWGALMLLILNDHAFKGAGTLPGWLTGKLSDVAGLIVLPPLLAMVFGPHRRVGRIAALALSGLALATVNLWPAAARALEFALGSVGVGSRLWSDPSDLLALPALLLAAPLCLPAVPLCLPPAPQMPWRSPGNWSRPLQRIGLLVAALACVATAHDDDGSPKKNSDAPVLENRSDGTLTVLLASTEAAGGCRLYRDDRVAAITPDAFVNKREVTLEADESVPLAEEAPNDCGAAWVQLPDGDELFLFWHDLDPIEGFVPEDDGARRGRVLVVEGREGRYTTDHGDDLFRFELGDEPPETSCPDEDIEFDLDWTTPAAAQGFFELDEIRETDDGCLEVDWISQSDETTPTDTQRLCVPEWAFPFEAREILSVVVEHGMNGGRRLHISRLEEGAVALQLVLWSGAGEDLLDDSPIASIGADDCFGELTACGAYVRPAELELGGGDAPLRGGDDAEIDAGDADATRVLVGPSIFVDWTSAACQGTEAHTGASATWLELREF